MSLPQYDSKQNQKHTRSNWRKSSFLKSVFFFKHWSSSADAKVNRGTQQRFLAPWYIENWHFLGYPEYF